MTDLGRNYFTLEKVSSDDLEKISKIHDRMIEYGIVRKLQDPQNLELEELDQRYEFTDNFENYVTKSMSEIFWHLDKETGELKKFTNPKMMKKAKHRQEEFDKMRRIWTDGGGHPDKFIEFYTVGTLADTILEFKVIKQIVDNVHKNNPDMDMNEPTQLPMKKISKLVDLESQKLDEEGNTEYEDMARLVYGWIRYKYESKADRLLTKRLVHYEMMTDTGHLTTVFKDMIVQIASEDKISLEQMANDESKLFAIIVEFTRDEDYEDPKAYLDKKTEYELQEYNEMVRIVSRCILIDIVKAKEENRK